MTNPVSFSAIEESRSCTQSGESGTKRTLILVYGVPCHALFSLTFLYSAGFVNNLHVPKSVSSGEGGAVGHRHRGKVGLLGLFAIQRTIMARPAFKTWFAKIVLSKMRRSTFVLLSTRLLCMKESS